MFLIAEAATKKESRQTFFPVDDLLRYNSLEQLLEKVSKIAETEIALKDTEEMTLEEEVESLIPEKGAEAPQLRYSFSEEQFMMEQALNAPALGYEKKWYKEGALSQFEAEEEYEASQMVSSEAETEILSSEEAKEVMVEIQYAAMLGSTQQIDPEKREKLQWYILTNSSLFKLMERMCGIGGDVNYGSWV